MCAQPRHVPRMSEPQALKLIQQAIRDGGEYPDVEWQVSQRSGIASDRLRALYDGAEVEGV